MCDVVYASYFLMKETAIVTTFIEVCHEFLGAKSERFVGRAYAAKSESQKKRIASLVCKG